MEKLVFQGKVYGNMQCHVEALLKRWISKIKEALNVHFISDNPGKTVLMVICVGKRKYEVTVISNESSV